MADEVLIINQVEVPQLLPMAECLEVMAVALTALARGDAILPLRPVMSLPGQVGMLVMMPSYLGDLAMMGVKVISYFPGNRGSGYDSHQGPVLLYETKNGRLVAIVDATAITAIRTAAVSAVATRLLARETAGDLAILGTGTQATTHLEAMRLVRPIRRVRVWSLNHANVQRFADHESQRWGITIEPQSSAEAAVVGADIVCTTTSAAEPVLLGKWLVSGAHVNAVGSSVPHTRELDTAAVVRSRLFVDRRESALNEAGDILFPKREGAISDDHIVGELGDLLLGRLPGRRAESEITLFKSLGLAIEDLAAAHYVYTRAVQKGLGTRVQLGGSHHGST